MAESSKMAWFFGAGLPQRGLVLSGTLALAGLALAFAPVLPRPGIWQVLQTPAATPAVAGTNSTNSANSNWAGHLESPGAGAPATEGVSQKLTSASYTTGFNTADAGPLPAAAPPKAVAAHDPNACPDDLNCAFRSKPSATAARPQTAGLSASIHAAQHQGKKPAGLAAFMPHLPSAHTLLKPFAFVANTFGGLIHKL